MSPINKLVSVILVSLNIFVIMAFTYKQTESIPHQPELTLEISRKLECLAHNIYYEAGHESLKGKIAVAQVTINRSQDSEGKWPRDLCDVVYQKNVRQQRIICQFSWYCNPQITKRPLDPYVFEDSMHAAKLALLENYRIPELSDAYYYHADYVNPRWKLQKITKIGRHVFYGESV